MDRDACAWSARGDSFTLSRLVRRGEYLERAVVIPGEGGSLEALYHRGDRRPAVVIAPPHPLDGGAMETPVIAELAWAVTRRGHPALRFNYRGIGASAGTFDAAGAVADAVAAADHLKACVAADGSRGGGASVIMVGVGMGAEVAARCVIEARVAAPLIVLVAADPGRLPLGLDAFDGEVLAVCGQEDRLSEREALQERCAHWRRGQVAVIPHADRTFVRSLVELGRVVADRIAAPQEIDLSSE